MDAVAHHGKHKSTCATFSQALPPARESKLEASRWHSTVAIATCYLATRRLSTLMLVTAKAMAGYPAVQGIRPFEEVGNGVSYKFGCSTAPAVDCLPACLQCTPLASSGFLMDRTVPAFTVPPHFHAVYHTLQLGARPTPPEQCGVASSSRHILQKSGPPCLQREAQLHKAHGIREILEASSRPMRKLNSENILLCANHASRLNSFWGVH
jgi:hypothetical protein